MKQKLKNYAVLTTLLAGALTASAAGTSNQFHETVPGIKMRHMGPGNGGSMFGVAFKPDNPKVIIFGGDMGACYRTENGGKTWTVLGGHSGDHPRATWVVKFHPKQTNIVWQAGSGIVKSTDGGKSWKNTKPPLGTYGALGLDPDNPNIVYVSEGQAPRMVLGWTHGKVLKTTDGGKSWKKITRPGGPEAADKIKQRNYTNIIVDPSSKVINGQGHARVYIFGRGGLYRSEDAGKSWKDLSGSFAPGQVTDMVMVKNNGKRILFLTATPAKDIKTGGVYRSDDKGESWKPLNSGLQGIMKQLAMRNKKLSKDPKSPLFTLMLAHSPQNPNRLYAGSWQGIARSDDLGKSWQEILPRESSYARTQGGDGVAVLTNNKYYKKSLWGGIDHFNRLVAAPSNADIVAFDDNQGLYCSLNGGKLWDDITFDFGKKFAPRAMQSSNLPPNRFTNKTKSRGVQNIVSDQIAIDPFNPKVYYAAYMDLGLEISRDGGEYWEHPTTGTPARGHAWAIAVDPGKKGRVFVTIGQKWHQPGGIYRSADSGKSWTKIGLKDASMGVINDIEIDLTSPVNNRTIYISTEKKGIYKSTDGGKSWNNMFKTQDKTAQNTLCVKIAKNGKIYVGSMAGLMVSSDKGKSWKLLKQKLFERVKRLSISASNPNVIYITANLPKNNFYWGKAGFFKSTDAGKSWKNITPSYIKYAGAIMVNPHNPNYVYACTNLFDANTKQKQVIIRSKDGGKSWQDIGNGISFARGVNFSIDINNSQHLFAHARFGLIEILDSQAPKR